MTADTALWIGLAAGAVIGTAGTWITIGIATALGRHLAHQHNRHTEPATDTFDNDLRALIRTQTRRP